MLSRRFSYFYWYRLLLRFCFRAAVNHNRKSPDAENYLAGIVYRQVSADYPLEAVKAQVVLARSTFVRQVKEGSMTKNSWSRLPRTSKPIWRTEIFDKQYERIQRAVINTRGEVLAHDGEVCFGVFHRLSTGRTRNAKGCAAG